MEYYPFFPRPYYYRNYARRDYPEENLQKHPEYRQNGEQNRTYANKQTIKEECKTTKMQNQSKPDENPIFEIFGIRLFLDDILIISLIFFLYNEGVRDNLLFVSLILILLS